MKSIRMFGQPCGSKYAVIAVIIMAYLPILLLTVPVIDGEEVSSTRFMSKDSGGPLSITSKKMTLTNQENTILFEGDVVLERNSMTLKAREVEVVFTFPSDQGQRAVDSVEKKRELSKITATGNVEVVQGTRTILSDKVIYYKKDEKMVFTGSPNVHQGDDQLKGERITVYIREDRVVVESGEAIIHPK